MIMLTISLVIFTFNTIYANAIEFTSCGGKISQVRTIGCINNTIPCILTRGNTAKLEVDFEAPFTSTYVQADLKFKSGTKLFPIYIPVVGVHRDACSGHNLKCPLNRGQKYTYIYEIKLSNQLPAFTTEYILKLKDFWGYEILCLSMLIKIQ